MARDYARDYRELPEFAKGYVGRRCIECIEDYARKRKIVIHRAGKAFWWLVDSGKINVDFESKVSPYYVIKSVKVRT